MSKGMSHLTSMWIMKKETVRFFSRCMRQKAVFETDVIRQFKIKNEPVLEYRKGSEERAKLEQSIKKLSETVSTVPVVIGNKEFLPNECTHQLVPHNHKQVLAKIHYADKDLLKSAISTALEAQKTWQRVPWEQRIRIFRDAADLIATKYRFDINAATVLGQSKNFMQAEIDSACELVDFLNFNAYYTQDLLQYQPISPQPKETENIQKIRGLEGFIAAISPFNFTAIGGNLAYAPALMGNVVLWKPSDSAALSSYIIFKAMQDAGLPPGVVNFVPADGPLFGNTITSHPSLTAINFTGSAKTFEYLWKQVGNNISNYKTYPRLIGECGGKNFHFVHNSADIQSVIVHTIRSAFEYGGQKCSACSRLYVPESKWPEIKSGLLGTLNEIKVGDPSQHDTFMGAVIDETSFNKIQRYIELAKEDKNMEIIGGGSYNKQTGYFINPTIILSKNPSSKLMTEEIFGPVLTVYVYKDDDVVETLSLVDSSTPYALTGAVFAQDEKFLKLAYQKLFHATGNYYINDKSTGAIVGQQPFGGARKSGTNDKAGGPHYLLRFASLQTIKQTHVPSKEWKYPHMLA